MAFQFGCKSGPDPKKHAEVRCPDIYAPRPVVVVQTSALVSFAPECVLRQTTEKRCLGVFVRNDSRSFAAEPITSVDSDPPVPELDWSHAPIQQEIRADWKTPEILIEGALNSTKTTIGLDKEIEALAHKYPGIPTLFFRWTEDAVTTKLKPAFDEIMSIRGLVAEWDAKEKRYLFPNGSMAYMFGLKAVSQIEIFNKIRGLGVCRIFGDQCEEMDRSVAGELRGRLRPNLTATLRGRKFPFQLTFVANCEDHDFWLSKEFPLDNHIAGRKVYSLSVFDNPFAPQASIDSLVRQFPPDHPKHQTMVLGRRGPNVVGDPVFEGFYRKEIHHRPIGLRKELPIYESFEIGTHNPTWTFCQPVYAGGISVMAGIRGEEMLLEDFLPAIQDYRAAWFDGHAKVQSCIAPMGEKYKQGNRRTPMDTLRDKLHVHPELDENGNAPDVRLAMIEELGTMLRRRGPSGEECFGVNNDPTKFLIVNRDGPRESPFVHHALEAGYIWDKHKVSVANKEIRKAHEDDKFALAMHCIENILLNFCAGKLTMQEAAQKRSSQRPYAGMGILKGGPMGFAQ